MKRSKHRSKAAGSAVPAAAKPALPARDAGFALLAALSAAAIVRLWIQPMGNSFWLDETLVAWTIRAGFGGIVQRAFISLQSILFCAVEWPFAQLSASEISLRLPSLLAGLGSLYVYYRIGREIADRELGLILAVLFIATPSASVEVPNARPYALALFFHAAALYGLLAWLRSGRLKHGLLWSVCAAAAVHGHHLFVVSIPIYGLFALWSILKGRTQASIAQLSICAVVCAILLAPAAPQVLAIMRQGKLLSYLPQPTWGDLVMAMVPLTVLPALAIAALAGRKPRWTAKRPGADAAVLGAMLLFVPTLAFFGLSRFTGTHIFSARYLLPTVPAFVVLWGWVLHGFTSPGRQRLAVAVVLLMTVVFLGGFSIVPDYRQEDWRDAVNALPDSGLVVVYPGLVETRQLGWLQSPEHWSYFTAPVNAYRPDVTASSTFVLPFEMRPEDVAYVERLVAGPLHDAAQISVIANGNQYGPAWADWLTQRLTSMGYREEQESMFRVVRVRVFRAVRHGT